MEKGCWDYYIFVQSYWGDRHEMHNLYDENKHENDGSDTIAIESTSSVIHKA